MPQTVKKLKLIHPDFFGLSGWFHWNSDFPKCLFRAKEHLLSHGIVKHYYGFEWESYYCTLSLKDFVARIDL